MGFFSKKPTATAVKNMPEEKPVNSVGPVNAPYASPTSPKAAEFDADIFFKEQEHKSVKGPKSIKQNILEQRMRELEIMLENRPEALDYRAYDKNPVKERELMKANDSFDEIIQQIKEKEAKTRYKHLREAVTTDFDKKLDDLSEQYDYLTDDEHFKLQVDFVEVMENEAAIRAAEIDMAAAENRERHKSLMPDLSESQKKRIDEFVESDIKAKPIDVPDDIPALSPELLDKLTQDFEAKYGNLKDAAEKASKEQEQNKLDEQDAQELERLLKEFDSKYDERKSEKNETEMPSL